MHIFQERIDYDVNESAVLEVAVDLFEMTVEGDF